MYGWTRGDFLDVIVASNRREYSCLRSKHPSIDSKKPGEAVDQDSIVAQSRNTAEESEYNTDRDEPQHFTETTVRH